MFIRPKHMNKTKARNIQMTPGTIASAGRAMPFVQDSNVMIWNNVSMHLPTLPKYKSMNCSASPTHTSASSRLAGSKPTFVL